MGVAAGALVLGFYPQACGWSVAVASAQEVAVESQAMTRQAIRAAARDLVDLITQNGAPSEQAEQYVIGATPDARIHHKRRFL
jgi:hypothetical protein